MSDNRIVNDVDKELAVHVADNNAGEHGGGSSESLVEIQMETQAVALSRVSLSPKQKSNLEELDSEPEDDVEEESNTLDDDVEAKGTASDEEEDSVSNGNTSDTLLTLRKLPLK